MPTAKVWTAAAKSGAVIYNNSPPLRTEDAAQMLIQDEVHGEYTLPPHIEEIVLHPLFERLKKVHQLGFVSLVTNAKANHTRYDHCIGTYKCAYDYLGILERNSSRAFKLPKWCRQAVEIAALLHDIGHGPFSHSWEHVCEHTFKHEQNALGCVKRIFALAKHEDLRALRDQDNGKGVQLIGALIVGNRQYMPSTMCEKHSYIFDIVNNQCCGIDVDKWDYLRRDNCRLAVLSNEEMNFNQIFLQSRISADGRRIEYRYEDYHRIYKLYVARWQLHVRAYQLPKHVACDELLRIMIEKHCPHLKQINIEDGSTDTNTAWLELYDERLNDLIDNDDWTSFVRQPQRLQLCNYKTDGATHAQGYIKGPGETMPPDDAFQLYGDLHKKCAIERQIKSTLIDVFFKLQKSEF